MDEMQVVAVMGSPPHTRGILEDSAWEVGKGGITPAHAGNTRLSWSAISSARDHPRTRGEYLEVVNRILGGRGSPPHTRGIPSPSHVRAIAIGITPAHAGNTPFRFRT